MGSNAEGGLADIQTGSDCGNAKHKEQHGGGAFERGAEFAGVIQMLSNCKKDRPVAEQADNDQIDH